MRPLLLIALLLSANIAFAQWEPETANVYLYFPHFADGGTPGQQWQTTFTFSNPGSSLAASVQLLLFGDDGSPLAIDLGSGTSSSFTFSIPPNGVQQFRSRIASSSTVTGWAVATSTVPVIGNVAFRLLQGGTAKIELTAPPSLPTFRYFSYANPLLGIALVNPWNDGPAAVTITVRDATGFAVAAQNIELPPQGHVSFNLNSKFSNIPAVGSIQLDAVNRWFIAWTVNADPSGTISTLPDGKVSWPSDQWFSIWRAFEKIYAAASPKLGPGAVSLNITSDKIINAFEQNGQSITVTLALAELISDSPSELAFVIGHEFGHIYQVRNGHNYYNPDNIELDADIFGTYIAIQAGYDPYGAAGALAKLAMVLDEASLSTQIYIDNLPASIDLHKSVDTRIADIFSVIKQSCAIDFEAQQTCAKWKGFWHPHFPDAAPLQVPTPPAQSRR